MMLLFCCSCSGVIRLRFGDGNFVRGDSVMWESATKRVGMGRDRFGGKGSP